MRKEETGQRQFEDIIAKNVPELMIDTKPQTEFELSCEDRVESGCSEMRHVRSGVGPAPWGLACDWQEAQSLQEALRRMRCRGQHSSSGWRINRLLEEIARAAGWLCWGQYPSEKGKEKVVQTQKLRGNPRGRALPADPRYLTRMLCFTVCSAHQPP